VQVFFDAYKYVFYPEWGTILIAVGKTHGTFTHIIPTPNGVELPIKLPAIIQPRTGLALLPLRTIGFTYGY
jgi:hypothetical protein